jgi:exonuclease III
MTGQRELGKTSRTVGLEKCRLSAFTPFVVSTYNVRTLHQHGKIHQLFTGCTDAGIDIIGIQEHRLITTNPTDELWSDDKNWVLIYSTATDQRQGGVGLLMSKQIYKCLQNVNSISNRIITATFHGNPKLTVTSVYAPTESATIEDKNEFYNSLENHLEQVKAHNIHLVLGDFNARVGVDSHLTHPDVIGCHCFYDTTNNNGERLVSMCEEHKLHPSQMIFPQPRNRQWTWMHPSGSTNQLDHILINRKWTNSLRNCRAYNSVELDSDHRIVSITLVCSLRTTKGKPCNRQKFDWKKLQDVPTRELFQLELSKRFETLQCQDTSTPITQRYGEFEQAVAEIAEKVVGKRTSCGLPGWVTDRTINLKTERDAAKRRYLVSKSKQSRENWRRLNSNLNESYRSDETAMITKQMEDLSLADLKGDYTTTWKIVHDLSGKHETPSVKVKKRDGTPPTSVNDLLAEWKEYFSSLLNNSNGQPPSELPPPAAQDLPVHVTPPTREETFEAIHQMKNNKAPGLDCAITAEALRNGGDAMIDIIHGFCSEVYRTLSPPSQWTTSVIVPLPKKGDLSLMTNYRGISLLSITAKVYNKILLNRIRDHVDPILRSNQAGFRQGRSCAQQIHILRRIMEGFQDYQLPLTLTFIDFKKAFDSINRKVMFAVLRHYGIPEAVVNAISALYNNSKSAVMVDGSISDPFNVSTGVLQGDVLAPFLFIVLVDFLLKKATSDPDLDSGVVTHPRRSRRYPAQVLNDLDFADDIALLESTTSRAQLQLTKTAAAAKDLGLTISVSKTEYMTANCHPHPTLTVYGEPIKHVTDFKYLGSKMASTASDLKRRKALAWCAFWKLEHLWKSSLLSIPAKVKLFRTTCVTILLYGCESWVLSLDMESKINAFATSCYRIMLNIKRKDHVPNTSVYAMTETKPLIHSVRNLQLRFLGHILRMPEDEPARKYALYLPPHGKRRPGRPRTTYLTYIQRVLGYDEGLLQAEQIATLAKDRYAWRNLVVACSAAEG